MKKPRNVPATPLRRSTGSGDESGAAGIPTSETEERTPVYAIIGPTPKRRTSAPFTNAAAMKPALTTAVTQPIVAAPRCRSRTK